MHLDFAILDPADTSEPGRARFRGWSEAVARGFHEQRVSDDAFAVWQRTTAADRAVLRGAWVPEGEYGAGPIPVATFTSFGGEINTGGRPLPLHYITDVTVSPAHRRQGLLRRLMTEDLEHAVAEGRPLAALTVSEGSIYGRFGFGNATWRAQLEVDVSARFQLPGTTRYGRFEAVEPADLWPVPRDVFAAWHARSRGSLTRPSFYDVMARAEWDWEKDGPDTKLRGAVHLDESGEPDGYLLYRHEGWDRPWTATVRDLVGATPRAELAMWQFLADLDLCDRVKTTGPVDDPLALALADPQCRRVTGVQDHIWLRVLDVVAALEARPWHGDGTVVLEVDDPLGHAAGRWRVEASGGGASVSRTDEAAGVRTDAAALGSLYLGGTRVDTLVSAGRLTGDEKAVATWSEMADGGPAPFSRTSF